jgi:hypothetical protein
MSYLSLLLASQVRSLSNASEVGEPAERETLPPPAWLDVVGERGDDCILPSGVASLEHWLDLNA